MKVCTECRATLDLHKFGEWKDAGGNNIVFNKCKKCMRNTKPLVASKIYSHQKESSLRRGHTPPYYSREWLYRWLVDQELFHELYEQYKTSGYQKNLKPSVDRIDNSIGYTKDNIQLMTWEENNTKGRDERGVPIGKFSESMELICTYDSMSKAAIDIVGTTEGKKNIFNAISRNNKAYGFYWRYLYEC